MSDLLGEAVFLSKMRASESEFRYFSNQIELDQANIILPKSNYSILKVGYPSLLDIFHQNQTE